MGLIVHDIADPYFSAIAHGAQRGLAASGMQLMVASTERRRNAEARAVQTFMSYRTNAILIAGTRGFDDDEQLYSMLKRYQANGGRPVMIGQPPAQVDGVRIADRRSAGRLARELLRMGYKRFITIAGEEHVVTSRERAEGFTDQLLRSGIEPEAQLRGAFTRDGGYLMMAEYLRSSSNTLPTGDRGKLCVFCTTDVMALGALAAARDAGLTVPDDIALCGYGDIQSLNDHSPSITTVRIPLEEIGELSVEIALGDPGRHILIEGTPMLRESTAT